MTLILAAGAARAATRLDPPHQPLAFEVNRGQTAPEVTYLTRGPGYILYLTRGDAVLALASDTRAAGRALTMHLVGAARRPAIRGAAPLPGRHNYYIGDKPARWHTGIPTYGEVDYTGIYPGIDMVYHGRQGLLEYDFHIAPGADPAAVRLSFSGADGMKVNGNGDLVIDVGGRQVVHHAPYAYQTVDGAKQPVATRYVLHDGTVAFRVGHYDTNRSLVIDPALNYSSYLGGLGDDAAYGVAVDASGNRYITGSTNSTNFPGATNSPNGGGHDAFVTKIDSAGNIVFTTYLGSDGSIESTGAERGDAIAVGSQGKVYVTGGTAGNASTTAFPTTSNRYKPCPTTNGDVFVTILNTDGSLDYSSCIGGGLYEEGYGIALDGSDDIYVVGYTTSPTTGTGFPTTSGAIKSVTGNPNSSPDQRNGFFFKLRVTPSSSNLVYSTYVGGDGIDEAHGIALDGNGHAYITGYTKSSSGFPITASAYQTTGNNIFGNTNGQDAFLVGINPDPNTIVTHLLYGTYFGGSDADTGNGIAMNTTGSAVYITGSTASTDLPAKAAFQTSNAGQQDAFIAELDPTVSGSSGLLFSTYLGGSVDDAANAVAVGPNSRVYVVGTTSSSAMFGSVLAGTAYSGGKDAFAASLESFRTALYYAAYLGGSGDDDGRAIAIDSGGSAHIVGDTASPNFPVTGSATQASNASASGGQDAFLSVIGTAADMGITSFTGPSPPPQLLQPLAYSINVTNSGPDTATNVILKITFDNAGLDSPSFGGTSCTTDSATNPPPSLITCTLGTLTSGQLTTVDISGTLTTASSMTATATVTADQLDTNSTNDTKAWEVTASTSSQPVQPPTNIGNGGGSSSGGGGGGLGPGALAVLCLLAVYANCGGRRRRGRGSTARDLPAIAGKVSGAKYPSLT